jgi:hypothetical protein
MKQIMPRGGKTAGARNRLNTNSLNDLLAEWQEGGREAVKAFRMKDPGGFVKAVLSTLPREFVVETVHGDLDDEDIDLLIERLKQQLLEERQQQQPILIEGKTIKVSDG